MSSIIHIVVWRLMFEDRRTIDEATFIESHIDMVLRGLVEQH